MEFQNVYVLQFVKSVTISYYNVFVLEFSQCAVHIVVGPCAKGHFIHVGS
jgi:hypothetical protein